MRRLLFVLVVVGLGVGALTTMGHAEDPKVKDLMQKKLDRAQKILEGVATNDFAKISKNADDLIEISKATEWRVIKTPRYELYSNEFQRTADTLVKNAKDKNLDAAALTYVELTLTCVKCHKYVREVRMVRFEEGQPVRGGRGE
jgi:hypothetical protein